MVLSCLDFCAMLSLVHDVAVQREEDDFSEASENFQRPFSVVAYVSSLKEAGDPVRLHP